MKIKRSSLSSQILILMLAALVLLLMAQMAQAQTQNQRSDAKVGAEAQVLQLAMPQKSLGRRLLENTSLSFYSQFLGGTAGGFGETYNVFQEPLDTPGRGQAPIQSFHALNLRHQINTDWAIGSTLSAVNGYGGDPVMTKDRTGSEIPNPANLDFFNARLYVSLPPLSFSPGTLFTTLSYEHPTSSISKADNMKWGWVAAQTFSLNLPSVKWTAGLTGQIYRMYFENNVKAPIISPTFIGTPTALQTMIISGGPYVNYRFNDRWMLASLLTFDWDQRGVQSGSRDFNNNLSDRGRMTLQYFPQKIKYIQSLGVFAQTLLKFRPDTTALGADLAVRF